VAKALMVLSEKMNNYDFQIKFDIESSGHAVKTSTYVQSLISLSTVLREVNYQLGTGHNIEINIVAENKGSFEAVLQLLDISKLDQLFNKNNIEILAAVVGTSVGLIQLKRYLAKADPENVIIQADTVEIRDAKNEVLFKTQRRTYDLYSSNQAISDAIAEQFKRLEQDVDIKGFEIASSESSTIIPRAEFKDLTAPYQAASSDAEVTEVAAKLVILKVVFENRQRKWDFIYNGVKISAHVTDKQFWEEITAGKQFSQGDELVATLKIRREFDESVATYLNRDYEITNVRQHLPRQYKQQTTLDDLTSHDGDKHE
jgi:hypothetical protein